MYICNVRINKQIINNKNKNSMCNNVNNSQSTAAVNSANVSIKLSAYFSSEFGYRRMYITDDTFNDFKLKNDSLYMFLVRAISDSKIHTHFILEDSTHTNRFCFSFSKNEDGYIVVTEEWSGSDHEYYMGDRKRFTFGNISDFADRLCDIIADYYYGIYAAEENITEAEVSEAPSLDQAPSLEDDYTIEEVCDGFYEIVFNDEDDDITEEGYSIMGLNYLRENMVDADIEDIVDEAYEEVSNDLYVWLNELFRCGECPKNEFMDTMWAYAWDIIRDRGLSDEALEAETRYYTEFDDIVERRLEEWGLYERYNKIYMERTYSNR